MQRNTSAGISIIYVGLLAGIAAAVITFALWSATDLVFGGAAIIGTLFAIVAFIFGGMAGGEPVVRYQPGQAPVAPPAPTTRTSQPAPAPAPAPAAAAPTPAATREPTPAPEPAAEPATSEPAGEGAKPEMLTAARDGGPDNLKEIKGVGPKLEKLLHSMGVFHFDQIAGWTADEIAWVDANLEGFKGRVSRDNWVDQAKTLASGAETEFSKRVDKGEVY